MPYRRVFVRDVTVIPVPPSVALDRLLAAAGGRLDEVASEANEQGRLALTRIGPLGDVPGLAKRVRIRLGEPHPRGETTVVPLRWQATGATALFPVMDGNIELTPVEEGTELLFVGSYAPPLGTVGSLLDRAALSRVTAATVRALLAELTQELAGRPAPHEARRASPRMRPAQA